MTISGSLRAIFPTWKQLRHCSLVTETQRNHTEEYYLAAKRQKLFSRNEITPGAGNLLKYS